MAQQLRFKLDDTIYSGIANPDDFGVTIAEEPTLQYRFVSYDNDLRFVGDAYAYLNGLIEGSCGCDLVNVTVEYLCGSGSWVRLCTGFIILAECTTNLDRCTITTKLYDNTFATLINNNKKIPFSLHSDITKNLESVVPPNYNVLDLYPPATGDYDTTNFVYGIRVEDAFTHLVACMTDNRVDVSAPAFSSGTFENLMVLNGRQILSPQVQVETIISFEQLFLALYSKLNISLSSTLQSNGRPLLTIDFAININNQSNTIDFISLSGVVRKQDTSRIYSSVNFGNTDFYEQWQCNSGDNACTFAQTPFRGFRDEVFGLLGECNNDTQLDLLTKDLIFDSNIIEDIFVWGNEAFYENAVIINSTQSIVPSIYKSTQGDPYGIGQTIYNTEFTNAETAQYWVGGIPNDLINYGQEFIQADTEFDYKSDNTPEESYGVIPTVPTSYLQFSGQFPVVGDAVLANPNYILGRTFKVPIAGIYTFFSRLIIKRAPVFDISTIFSFTSILHYNSDDEFITKYDGSLFSSTSVFNPITGDYDFEPMLAEVTATFVCNTGDLIRCDSSGYQQTGTGTFIIANSEVVDSISYNSVFRGIGNAINQIELQPYDPCDYKNYLYDFEAPLSMTSIQSMLDNPSAPVKFSRTSTSLNGINGICNQVSIDSITKQKAKFTLRSNDKL